MASPRRTITKVGADGHAAEAAAAPPRFIECPQHNQTLGGRQLGARLRPKDWLPIVGGAYLVAFGWYLALRFGESARQDLLVVLVAVYAIVLVITPFYERRLRDILDSLDPEERHAWIESDEFLTEFDADRSRSRQRSDWGWRVNDWGGRLALFVYPPLTYTVLRYRELKGQTPFDGFAVLIMLVGVVAGIIWRRRRLKRYTCPKCGGAMPRLAGSGVRYSCPECTIVWYLGQRQVGDTPERAHT